MRRSRETELSTEKDYSAAFVIDKAKLSRILEKLEERFRYLELPFQPTYYIHLSKGNKITLDSIEDVFKLDNVIRNPIIYLRIGVSASNRDTASNLACSIIFQKPCLISLQIRSTDPKLALQAFAELEEQMQRTFVENWLYQVMRGQTISLFLAFLICSPIAFVAADSLDSFESSQESRPFLEELLQKANSARSSEEKIDFLFELSKHEIEQELSSRLPLSINIMSFLNFNTLFLTLPMLVVLGCTFYALKYCYPQGVFLWGDYEEYYNRLVSRRSTIWNIVISTVILGIITNLAVIGLSGFLNLS